MRRFREDTGEELTLLYSPWVVKTYGIRTGFPKFAYRLVISEDRKPETEKDNYSIHETFGVGMYDTLTVHATEFAIRGEPVTENFARRAYFFTIQERFMLPLAILSWLFHVYPTLWVKEVKRLSEPGIDKL